MRKGIFISTLCSLVFLTGTVINGPGCANIVPPQGGPRDSIPPVLLKSSPGDSTVNFRGNKIVFSFDEFVDVQNIQENLLVSPLAKTNPVVDFRLKEVTVKLKDTLESNTTYSLDFGKAIRDITEGNVVKDFKFTFSTGSYIDSLELEGQVLLAETAKPDSTLIVMLHTSQEDSAVVKEKPKYIARLDGKGRFHFKNLPARTYAIYALKDEGGTRRYMGEKQYFAFADQPVIPGQKNDSLTLYAFAKKEATPPYVAESAGAGGQRNKPGAPADKRLKFQTNLANNQQDLLADLKLSFENPLKTFDSNGLRLYTDTTFQPVTGLLIEKDSSAMAVTLINSWKENTLYNLVLDKDFAEDSTGKKLLKSDTLSFVTKKKTDYGTLKIRFRNLDPGKNPVLQVILNQALFKSFPLSGTEFTEALFMPGDYELRILYDQNKNGVWDPGQFIGARKQPERVTPLGRKITIKANWINEFDIDINL
ncbi:MAG: Ig-like domain-containing protein [Sphingobacteriales bacterium]|nr:Ig-like domain-containing protein [Sphingobacteriales bacterium]